MGVICRIYDAVAEIYEPSFPAESAGAAKRAFATAVNDREHKYGKWPEDFILFQVGIESQEKLETQSLVAGVKIAAGHELVEKTELQPEPIGEVSK